MPMVKPEAAEPLEVVVAVEKVMVLPLTTSVEPSVMRGGEVVRGGAGGTDQQRRGADRDELVVSSLLTAVPVELRW